jgi:alpha-galactosidase
MKSPLLIGTNVSPHWLLCLNFAQLYWQLANITPETLEVLTNSEILAINQDKVIGTSVSPFRWGINVGVL